MSSQLTFSPGRLAGLSYTVTDAEGRVIDARPFGEPLEVLVGEGMLPAALEGKLAGMVLGQHRRVTLSPQEAYGPRDPALVFEVPRGRLSAERVSVGEALVARTADGLERVCFVVAADSHMMTLDANPPLAGQSLTVDVVLVTLERGEPDELRARIHTPEGQREREPFRFKFDLTDSP